MAASLASVPLLQKKTFWAKECVDQLLGQGDLRLDVIEVGGVEDLPGLFPDGLHDLRVAVPQGRHRDAAQKIQVAPPFLIPDPAALSPDQGDGRLGVGVHQDPGWPVLNAFS